MSRRIAIGVNWQGELDREQIFTAAKEADQTGVDSIWVAEAWGRDAFSLLTQIAERTERIGLGTAIVNVYSRTPAALAQHFATLDELSGGRVLIGLGSSGPRVIEHFHGVPFKPALQRMRETVELLRLFFKHEPVHYQGELFHLERGFTLRFEPVRKEVPILIATLAPKSVRMTAEIADGWFPIMIPLRSLADQVTKVRGWVREAGRDPAAFTVRSPGMVLVAETPERLEAGRRIQAGTLAFYCARMGDFYYRQLCRQGYQTEADAVRTTWKEKGSAAAAEAISPDMLDQMGFVGPASACVERLEAEREAGVDLHQVAVLESDPAARAKILKQLVG